MFETVIVEDNPMISLLNRKFVEEDDRFRVAGEFSRGADALRWLLVHPADLLILDVYMPVMTGTELLRELRMHGSAISVVMVTAAHDTQTLDELLKLGIVDYLVKPFTARRFHQALETFCRNAETLAGQKRINQDEIDRLLYSSPADAGVPKGLQERTADRVRENLERSGGEKTCEELAAESGLSAVTVRRYLNYLLENGEAGSRVNYDTGGRPCVVYWLKTP